MEANSPKRRVTRTEETTVEEIDSAHDRQPQTDNKDKAGGYDPIDIARAPLQPPHPETADTVEDTSNRKVVTIYIVGAVAGLIGVLLLFANITFLAIPLLIASGIAIIMAVFAPIH